VAVDAVRYTSCISTETARRSRATEPPSAPRFNHLVEQHEEIMTHPLSSLIREHEAISRLIDALSGYATWLEHAEGDERGATDLAAFARFFREFADEVHHDKEENVLIPILARNGFHWEEGVLAEVRQEHEQERYLVDVLCQASERDSTWSLEERRAIAATVRELAHFQRGHLTLENSELFPEVTRRLSGDVLEQLRLELTRFDSYPRHQALSVELMTIAEGLVRRYAPHLPSRASLPQLSVDPQSLEY
jgi:hemerythrin-like domain-containing protein